MRRTFLILCILALVVACNNLMAQDDKTSYDRSRKISDQLKNGTAPGMKFGPTSKKKVSLKEPTAAEKSARFGQQLKSGTLPNTNARGGGGSGTVSRPLNTNARRSSAGTSKLPSESVAGTEVKKSPPTIQAPKLDQGGVKEELTVPVHVNPKTTAPSKPTGATERKKTPGKE
ncbi:hypothetical protein [Pseudobacter ginsenosidimutans]|jgi:hypothetical protein|uniref:Uncharacterized protein n=1 Tax=Pseudobacter ginsenosidimutans TaxID=661488 RepID=A0A4Q7N0S9_9BACT|nr:hypothetical protein [Pseudobacter ginsenosidimutans]QEC43783.1 hypothetical protein FSB84_19645 [Pseudobacter ginsenosidimutans]RZS75201.1 hypothetical protein EV199_1063 [Pseudobacter ginsenosidimutans]